MNICIYDQAPSPLEPAPPGMVYSFSAPSPLDPPPGMACSIAAGDSCLRFKQ